MPKLSRALLQRWLAPLAVVLSISSFTSSQTPEKSDPCTRILTPNLSKKLEAEFPSWRPRHLSDLHNDDRQLWLNVRARECPGIAVGHFKSVTSLSYALLLVSEKDPTHGFKLVFVEPSDSSHQSLLLDQNDDQDSASMVISKAPPGKYSDFERTKTVRIRLDTINVEWLEKAAVVYYWSNGQFQTLQTSD